MSWCVEIVNCDPEDRCWALLIKLENKAVLFTKLYLPCSDESADSKSEIRVFTAHVVSNLLA